MVVIFLASGQARPCDKEVLRLTRPPVVLMYHGVDDLPPDMDPVGMHVTPKSFLAQLRHLSDGGYHFLTEDEYVGWLSGGHVPTRSVLLTFDDGYRSVLEKAAPLMQEFSAPGVCYVCPGLLGGRSAWMAEAPHHPLMGPEEVRRLAGLGFAIGVHGHDHTALDSVPTEALALHTAEAAERVEHVVGVPARTFAYPYGAHDRACREAVRRSGFEAAFSVSERAGRWAIPRIDVNPLDTSFTFALKLSSAYRPAHRLLARTPGLRHALRRVVGNARP